MVSVCPLLSSPWCLEEDASSASPSRPSSCGPAPTLLFASSSPSLAPAPFPSPSLSAGAPSRGDLSPSLGPGDAPEGRDRVHAPVKMDMLGFLANLLRWPSHKTKWHNSTFFKK